MRRARFASPSNGNVAFSELSFLYWLAVLLWLFKHTTSERFMKYFQFCCCFFLEFWGVAEESTEMKNSIRSPNICREQRAVIVDCWRTTALTQCFQRGYFPEKWPINFKRFFLSKIAFSYTYRSSTKRIFHENLFRVHSFRAPVGTSCKTALRTFATCMTRRSYW